MERYETLFAQLKNRQEAPSSPLSPLAIRDRSSR